MDNDKVFANSHEILSKYPDIVTSIGFFFISYAKLELALHIIFGRFICIKDNNFQYSSDIIGDMSISQIVECIKRLNTSFIQDKKITSDANDKLSKLLDEMLRINALRNKYAHGVYSVDTEGVYVEHKLLSSSKKTQVLRLDASLIDKDTKSIDDVLYQASLLTRD